MLSINKVKTELFPYSKGVTTADSSAYLILTIFTTDAPPNIIPKAFGCPFAC